jgi:hypothetical protein
MVYNRTTLRDTLGTYGACPSHSWAEKRDSDDTTRSQLCGQLRTEHSHSVRLQYGKVMHRSPHQLPGAYLVA